MSGSWRRNERSAALEGQAHLRTHVDLRDALEAVLDGILGRDEVVLHLVELVEDRVEGRRLAASRRPGHEDHAVGVDDGLADEFERAGVEAEIVDAVAQLAGAEHAHDDLLAVDVGQRVDAEVDEVVLAERDLDGAVLRDALLCDVHVAHDLHARREGALHLAADAQHLHERSVDAEADAQFLLEGLDVDVRGAHLQCLEQEPVDEPHDRRVEVVHLEVDRAGEVVGRAVGVGGVDLLQRVLEPLVELLERRPHVGGVLLLASARGAGAPAAAVGAADGLLDLARPGHQHLHGQAGAARETVGCALVVGVARGHEQRRPFLADGDDAELARGLLRDELLDLWVRLDGRDARLLEARVLSHDLDQPVLGNKLPLDQRGGERAAGLLGFLELVRGQQIRIDERLPEIRHERAPDSSCYACRRARLPQADTLLLEVSTGGLRRFEESGTVGVIR